MVAITRCYPGPHPASRGDRVSIRPEQALCAPWLATELTLIHPKVLISIGRLAIDRFLGAGQPMTGLIGRRCERDGRLIAPLPHPCNVAENKARLARALRILRELRAKRLSQ